MTTIEAKFYVSLFLSLIAGGAWIASAPMAPEVYGWLLVCPLVGLVSYSVLTVIERMTR